MAHEPIERRQMQVSLNKIFGLLRLAYPAQYAQLYEEKEKNLYRKTKQLWEKVFSDYPSSFIMKAVERAIQNSKFMPTIAEVMEATRVPWELIQSAPEARIAYREACRASEPKAKQAWSHPLVYYTGVEVGWFFLASTGEYSALPIFREAYRLQCLEFVQSNQTELALPTTADTPALESKKTVAITTEEQLQLLSHLREKLKL